MKIILIEDVQNLGYKDDVVEVKNGYARNFLLPTKKAILATESALKQLAEKQKQQAQKMAKIKADAEALAEAVKAAGALEFAVKASEVRLPRLSQPRALTLRRSRSCSTTSRFSASMSLLLSSTVRLA